MIPAFCLLAVLGNLQTPPAVLPLWPTGAPGFESRKSEQETAPATGVIGNINNPSITIYRPASDKNTGAAILVFPGGGHNVLAFQHEGADVASYLTPIGVSTIVVKYRLAQEKGSPYSLDRDVQLDAYRAVRLVRHNAASWGIDPKRIGVMGFSAGSEVVNMVAFHYFNGTPPREDEIDHEDATVNFLIHVYPSEFGLPVRLEPNAPPAFVVIANDDFYSPLVPEIVTKYQAAKIPIEAHILSHGSHGFGLGTQSKHQSVKHWTNLLTDWLEDSGFLTKT